MFPSILTSSPYSRDDRTPHLQSLFRGSIPRFRGKGLGFRV